MSIVNVSVTPQVLKNRGVPADFHVMEQDQTGTWRRKFSEDDTPVLEKRFLKMTNAVLSDIEDETVGWGSLEAWQDGLQNKPFSTIGATIALMFEWMRADGRPDIRRAGRAMIEGGMADYSVAIGHSFMLANGAPEDEVVKGLASGIREAHEATAVQWKKMFAKPDDVPVTLTNPSESIRGELGQSSGASSVEDYLSSGQPLLRKSDS